MKDRLDLVVQRRAGGSVIDIRPLFSSDSETLFVVWDRVVRAYSVKTGEVVGEYEGLESNAVGVKLHPTNENAIVAVSEKAEVIQWDWRSRLPGEIVKLKMKKENMVVIDFYLVPFGSEIYDSDKCRVIAVLKDKITGKKATQLFCSQSGKYLSYFKFKMEDRLGNVALGGKLGQQYIACIYKNQLQYYDVQDYTKCDKRTVRRAESFTSIACHPVEKCIATGTQTGRVLLWWNILCSEQPSYATYHWHCMGCNAVAFSASGQHFYSGGEEAVLVKWNVESDLEKSFMPRLRVGIRHIAVAPDNKYLAVCNFDNGIMIITPNLNFQIISQIQHFTWSGGSGKVEKPFPAGILFDPRTKALVLNGMPGHIQFFSSLKNSLLYNMDITGMNYLTKEDFSVIVNTDVTKIAFSNDGHWLVTVEERSPLNSNFESRLKFWRFDDVKQNFVLNTSVELPHNGAVTAVAFQPTEDPRQQLLVTTGCDSKFRTWSLVKSSNTYKEGALVWRCESVGFYRNLPAGDISFSMDGSLLAVTFGPTLTIWIPETNQLKCSLASTKFQSDIRHVEFGRGDCCHLVVTSNKQKLNVWNLLSLRLMWTVPLNVGILFADPCSEFMAVFTTEKNNLYVFSPRSPKPVHVQESVISSKREIVSAALVPRLGSKKILNVPWLENSELFFISSEQELFSLEPQGGDTNENEKLILPISTGPISTGPDVTIFGSLIKKKVSHVKQFKIDTEQQLGVLGTTAIRELLEAPVHAMPPVNLLCGPFLRSLVSSSKKHPGEKESETEEDAVERMETEDSGVDSGDETSGTEVVKKPLSSDPSEHKTIDLSNPSRLADLESHLINILDEDKGWAKVLVK